MQASEDELIAEYLPLVRRLAWQMLSRLPANIEIDDLAQAGLMGLLDAIRRYEVQANAQFETYAVTRIRGAMLDELRSQDWLPRSVRTKARAIENAVSAVSQREQRAATEAEIAQELNVPISEYHQMLEEAHGMQVLHFEDFGRNSSEETGHALDFTEVADQAAHAANPLVGVVSHDLRAALIEAIKQLPEREQLLLSLQFEQDLNQKEIAAVMEITEGRVSQIRSQAVSRIRAFMKRGGWSEKPEDVPYQALL